MITLSYIMFFFAAVTFIGWVISKTLKRDLDRLEHLEKWSKEFYKNAELILKYEDLPQGVILDLKFINFLVGYKRSSRILAIFFLNGKGHSAKNDNATQKRNSLEYLEYFRKNDIAGKIFVEIFNSAFLTISYRSRLFGPSIRSNLSDIFVEKKILSASKFTDAAKKKFKNSNSLFEPCMSS